MTRIAALTAAVTAPAWALISGSSITRPYLGVAVAGIITTGLAPISLLFAFLLRITTATKRTVAIRPFTTD